MLRSTRRDVQSASKSVGKTPERVRSPTGQRLKGGHRLPATIVPKHELVQVDLT